jgi:AraC-like DNA-binding protein
MVSTWYEYFRGASGFTLAVCGIAFYLVPGRHPGRKQQGTVFASSGILFCLSALDPLLRTQTDLGNLIIIAAIYCLSQALYEIVTQILGFDGRHREARRVKTVGLVWSGLLVLLPLLDYAFGWNAVKADSEGGSPLGPVHAAASIAFFVWPLVITVVTIRLRHFSFRDLPSRGTDRSLLLIGMGIIALFLSLMLASQILGSARIYRIANTIAECFILAWYLYAVARPEAFARIRHEMHDERKKNLAIGDDEARKIDERLARVLASGDPLLDPKLDMHSLAAALKVPQYRLSGYFNERLGMSFSAWLNGRRIELACKRIRERPDLSILDIALDSGYASKSTFNTQFSRIVGQSPSEFRKTNSGLEAIDR